MIRFSESPRGPACEASNLSDVMKKGGASENTQILERNGNALGNGNGIGSDALGVVSGFHVVKVESAAESFEDVIVRLSEKPEGFGQYGPMSCLHFIWCSSGGVGD